MNDGPVNRLRLVVGWIIVIAWAASLIADAVLPEYDAPPTVHGLMLLVAGALFGPSITGRRRNDDS